MEKLKKDQTSRHGTNIHTSNQTKQKKKRNKLNQSAISIVLVLLISIVGCVSFVHVYNFYINETLYAERLSQMREVTTQLFSGLEEVVESQWNRTDTSCHRLEKQELQSVDELLAFMRTEAELEDFTHTQSEFVAIDEDGKYYTQKGEQGLLRERAYFSTFPEQISFVSNSLTYDESRMFFSQKLPEPYILENNGETVTLNYYGVSQNMEQLNPYFECKAYDGNNSVYVVDDDGLKLFSSNGGNTRNESNQGNSENSTNNINSTNIGLLKGFNAYNTLQNMEYLHGSSFTETKKELEQNKIAYSNALLDGEEIYYALYQMDNAAWTLIFLVPSRYVAINTVKLVNVTIQLVLFFAGMLVIGSVTAIIILMKKQQKAAVETEKKNNEALEMINAELQVAAETARQASKKAEAASKAKSDFLANMSHDIRTPMNAIVGITGLMEHEEEISDKLRSYIEKVQLSSRHLLGLINDILDMSRIESNEVTLNEEHVSLDEQISQIDTIIRSQTNEHSQKFEININQVTHNYLICDGVRLRQIMLNLLSNAVKYTPNGGTITLDLTEMPCDIPDHAHFLCCVTDTGYGMSPEFVPHIFEPFTRAENSVTNKVQGTGLGMAITKNIVDLMGGSIRVDSEIGKGSRFEVELTIPIDKEAATKAVEQAKADGTKEEETHAILKGMRFLCAEDNELNAEILKEILKIYDADCVIYPNGEEIVKAFENVKPGEFDVILMDIQMPKMNGLDATRAIRGGKNPLGKTIPIIAMTANAFSEDVKHCIEAGMNAHIAKPIDMVALEKALLASLK